MKVFKYLVFSSLLSLSIACGSGKENPKFQLELEQNKKTLQIGDAVTLTIKNPKKLQIDSVTYAYAGNTFAKSINNKKITKKLNTPLGKHLIAATVYYDNKKALLSKELILHNNKAPKLYTYKIINTYPHDIQAYTQGLEFYKDTLYESTGRYGHSSLRKVALTTGKVLEKTNLEKQYFAEGISILNNKIYLLTWREGKGFVYNTTGLKKEKEFTYQQSKEGWGLCNDGKHLYKSDGTDKIWLLDPETLEEKSYIQPTTHKSVSTRLNELEWVEGKIYANTYLKDGVAIINPKTGAIEGIIDLRGLREKVTQHQTLDVLNGIAYNPNTKKLYVTGKNWDKLFEIEIIEKS